MKTVRVVLSFHAHEPLWDLPRRLQRSSRDRRVRHAIVPESYIRRRMREGRNVYRDLIGFAERRGVSVAVDATNELLFQLRQNAPGTYRELGRAYRRKLLYPMYTTAHHTHAALLAPEEFLDEVRLNHELLHDDLGVPLPARRGLFFTECSIDAKLVPAAEGAGYDFCLSPDLSPERVEYAVDPAGADIHYAPYRVGKKLIALPRHFDVSQEIWRGITLREPARLKYQGFLLGEFPVFYEEYRQGAASVQPNPDADSVGMYAGVLRQALSEAPDGGLIVYLQDLELMDFGEQALTIIDQAWTRVMQESGVKIEMVSPDDIVRTLDPQSLPRVEVQQATWAPEIRPSLRYDGHYPPRGAGPFRGHDAAEEIFKRRPFVFWEPGKYITELFGWLLESFGHPRLIGASARVLVEEDYKLERFPPEVRLPALVRLMKRACNWGWYPEEGLNKRPYLDGLLVIESLRLELRLRQTVPRPVQPLPWRALEGMRRVPELLLDSRFDYLRFGLERWREEKGSDPEGALLEIERAAAMRRLAEQEIRQARAQLGELWQRPTRERWDFFLKGIEDHTKSVFLALDHVQRAWGQADPDFLIVPMYTYLHDIYPPKGPDLLDAVDSVPREVEKQLIEEHPADEAA
jgi:hypothetical protein